MKSGEGLGGMKNLGEQSVAWLTDAGFASREDLEAVGPAQAYRRVRERHPNVGKTFLFQLAGALLDLDVSELPGDLKQHLLFEVEAADRKAAGGSPPTAS
jgi:DNA transformation protein